MMDRFERRINNAVKVNCEVKTETAHAQMIIIEGRVIWLPFSAIHEVVRNDHRADDGYNGYVVIDKRIAEREKLQWEE